jgi:probable F420-dependent oxidoreductase
MTLAVDYFSGSGLPLNEATVTARAVQDAGLDGLWTIEANHEPFMPLALAAEHSDTLTLGTGVAIAFARNPMTMAHLTHELNDFCGGRLVLGIGSQIQQHIERRFSSPWSHPARRMRDFVLAMHAIWDTWNNKTPLDYRGEFYTHTLMNHMWDPGPSSTGRPKVVMGALGPRMLEVATEVADGMIIHPLASERYFEQVVNPAVTDGLKAHGRDRSDFSVTFPVMVATGRDDDELDRSVRAARERIAFYGSTPAYRPALEVHDAAHLAGPLRSLSRRGAWAEMADLIDDELLHAFCVIAPADRLLPEIQSRFAGLVDRICINSVAPVPLDLLAEVARHRA